jgi:hypothetical protein
VAEVKLSRIEGYGNFAVSGTANSPMNDGGASDMAYQSLNIVGSFTAGVPAIQREMEAQRDRVEAYRSLMRDQISRQDELSAEEVAAIQTSEHTIVDDVPHDRRRNPYLFLRYPRKSESGTAPPESQDEEVPGLDVVV